MSSQVLSSSSDEDDDTPITVLAIIKTNAKRKKNDVSLSPSPQNFKRKQNVPSLISHNNNNVVVPSISHSNNVVVPSSISHSNNNVVPSSILNNNSNIKTKKIKKKFKQLKLFPSSKVNKQNTKSKPSKPKPKPKTNKEKRRVHLFATKLLKSIQSSLITQRIKYQNMVRHLNLNNNNDNIIDLSYDNDNDNNNNGHELPDNDMQINYNPVNMVDDYIHDIDNNNLVSQIDGNDNDSYDDIKKTLKNKLNKKKNKILQDLASIDAIISKSNNNINNKKSTTTRKVTTKHTMTEARTLIAKHNNCIKQDITKDNKWFCMDICVPYHTPNDLKDLAYNGKDVFVVGGSIRLRPDRVVKHLEGKLHAVCGQKADFKKDPLNNNNQWNRIMYKFGKSVYEILICDVMSVYSDYKRGTLSGNSWPLRRCQPLISNNIITLEDRTFTKWIPTSDDIRYANPIRHLLLRGYIANDIN